MPTITKYRTWCSKCGEWVLHSSPFESNKWVCDRCGSTHEPYYICLLVIMNNNANIMKIFL